MVQGADCVVMGHVHELYSLYYRVEKLNKRNNVVLKDILHLRTGTYKEEYEDGYMDFHVERGRPPKPVGCFQLNIKAEHDNTKQILTASATSML